MDQKRISVLIALIVWIVLCALFTGCGVETSQLPAQTAFEAPPEDPNAPLPYAQVPQRTPVTQEEARDALSDAGLLEAAAYSLDTRTQALLEKALLGEVFTIPCAAPDGTLTEEGLTWYRAAYKGWGFSARFVCCREDGVLRVTAETAKDWNAVLEKAGTRTLRLATLTDESGVGRLPCALAGETWYVRHTREPLGESPLFDPAHIDISSLPALSPDDAGTPFSEAVPGFRARTESGSAAQSIA